ncbi:MAG: trypsin-like peptidase domain-containing protein [Mycobacteriaceae bacterium]|nr:trypsin-like peptidase domain-containing protein [Mycobacteriaceae bacterium]
MRVRSALMILLLGAALSAPGCTRPQPPAAASPASPPAAATAVHADPVVGAVFLGASEMHTCTGSVLHSTAGNLILTAAHCLAAGSPTTFVSGFSGTADPAGTWTIDAIYLDPRWLAAQDPVADFAIARVSRQDGRSVESAAGTGLTLGTTPSPGTVVTVTGYPASVGGEPIGCRTATASGTKGFPSLQCAGLIAGTSGAPWRRDSTIVGLIGGLDGGGCDENLSYSPPFDGKIADLLRRAEAGGPADTAPSVSEDGC